MDKNNKEKRLLKDFAADKLSNSIFGFTEIDSSVDTYYISRSGDEEYIQEYGFDTALELRQELENLWKNDEGMFTILRTILVAALKNKLTNEFDDANRSEGIMQNSGQKEKLLPYIYNF